jgi:thiamine-monophosphate kinase
MPKSTQPARRTEKPQSLRGELALIAAIRQRTERSALSNTSRSSAVRLGIGDDCAILRPPAGHEVVVTTDLSLEGRHFRRDTHPPRSIGHRALARGLSDLAAMGARPLAAFLSLAVPRSLAADRRFIDDVLEGLLEMADTARVSLAGGDTSESPSDHLLLDIVLLGSVPAGRALRRDAARPGDALYVTGALGGAAVELEQVLSHDATLLRARAADQANGSHPHLFPEPRLAVGQALVRRSVAHAAIDLSDGLSTDLTHLCDASGVGAELELAALPAHALTTALPEPAQIAAVLHGGEDYELLFTARPGTKMPRSIAGVPITRIGRIVAAPTGKPRKPKPTRIQLVDGKERFGLEPRGWEHLR